MAGSLRFLARSTITSYWLKTRTPTTAVTSATLRCCVSPNINCAPYRCYSSTPQAVPSSGHARVSDNPPPPSQLDPNWRHPRLGLAVADYPCLVHLNIPPKATEEDVKALLLKAGFPDAQVKMFYDVETGKSGYFCFTKLADEKQVDAAITTLSGFTFFGSDLTPQKYDPEKFPHWHRPSLFAGWQPSPSSDLESRVIRPPVTAPPKLLPPLMAEQWVQFQNLPPVDPARKEARFEILREFYAKFHQLDVVGITNIREHHNKLNGWYCNIQFGSPKEAATARKSHLQAGKFMGRVAKAKSYRAGPDVHKLLWDYRQSLPETTSESDLSALLENKYRELTRRNKSNLQRSEYPTPESAIGLKKDASTSS